MNRVIRDCYLESSEINELRSAVEANAAIRLALLQSTVQRQLSDDDLFRAVFGFLRPSTFTYEDVVQVSNEQLTRVYADWQAQCAKAIAQLPTPKPVKPESEKRTVNAKAKLQLTERLSALAEGTDTF